MENSCADEYGNERSLLLCDGFVLVDNVLCVCGCVRVEQNEVKGAADKELTRRWRIWIPLDGVVCLIYS